MADADEAKTDTPVTDDQELAKVLASMSGGAQQTPPTLTHGVTTIQPPASAPQVAPVDNSAVPPPPPPPPPPAQPVAAAAPVEPVAAAAPAVAMPNDLDQIKKMALEELRPIVEKLELPPEEKFEALLLVIRSSDDNSLVKAAYDAAEGITDSAKKAQALLDVIKEIEYFSAQRGVAAA
ncbi:MAG TPA: hypothetical protein VGS28_01165 [Candidatus Saccharimonadales bacterium]|nr:hypothetical protein [Candidatus Saccharimonadales bacterium]